MTFFLYLFYFQDAFKVICDLKKDFNRLAFQILFLIELLSPNISALIYMVIHRHYIEVRSQ